jgi:DNA-binding transcriptional MocR family regulator
MRSRGWIDRRRLPTVRGLADALGIAPNTVARSYRELERDAVIETAAVVHLHRRRVTPRSARVRMRGCLAARIRHSDPDPPQARVSALR